jgi:VanZ family protein
MTNIFRLLFWLAVAAMLFFTLRTITVTVPGSDKTHHAITFGALMLLAVTAYPAVRLGSLAVILSALGAAVELIQPFFGRSCDVRDWVADTIGIVIATLLAGFGRKLLLRRRNPPL